MLPDVRLAAGVMGREPAGGVRRIATFQGRSMPGFRNSAPKSRPPPFDPHAPVWRVFFYHFLPPPRSEDGNTLSF